MRITQSFFKAMRAYLEGRECGNIIRETYVNGRYFDSEEPGAKELGSYFEFLISGALPKTGLEPKPVLMKDGTPDAKYRLAAINAKRVLQMLKDYGLEIIDAGKKLTKGKYEGTIDLRVRVVEDKGFGWKVGDKFIIDLKYSGLLDDKWNELGWMFTPAQKKFHGTQAIQYHFVGNLPFYFWITQSNNKEGTLSAMKFVHIPVDEFMIEQHIADGNSLLEHFETYKDLGFTPYPSFVKCQKCPLREECADRMIVPEIQVVNINSD